MSDYTHLKNKRLAGIDYGKKRIGVAVCDIFHITVSPKIMIENNQNKYKEIQRFIDIENIDALVVGVPYRDDDRNKEFLSEIVDFIENLRQLTGLNVYEQDESFSTIEAVNTMINIGYGKKKRREKGNKDKVAAAIILRNFLNILE